MKPSSVDGAKAIGGDTKHETLHGRPDSDSGVNGPSPGLSSRRPGRPPAGRHSESRPCDWRAQPRPRRRARCQPSPDSVLQTPAPIAQAMATRKAADHTLYHLNPKGFWRSEEHT